MQPALCELDHGVPCIPIRRIFGAPGFPGNRTCRSDNALPHDQVAPAGRPGRRIAHRHG